MAPFAIIKSLDIAEDAGTCVLPNSVFLMMHELGLERVKETLRYGVTPAPLGAGHTIQAWMKRGVMQEFSLTAEGFSPDFATLHPGYAYQLL